MRTRRGGFGAVAFGDPVGEPTKLFEDVRWHGVRAAVLDLFDMGGDVFGPSGLSNPPMTMGMPRRTAVSPCISPITQVFIPPTQIKAMSLFCSLGFAAVEFGLRGGYG
jgi:hypothetical protein